MQEEMLKDRRRWKEEKIRGFTRREYE